MGRAGPLRLRTLVAGVAGGLGVLLLLALLVVMATDLPGRGHRPVGVEGAVDGAAAVPVLVVDHGYHAGLVLPRAALAARAAALGLPRLSAVAGRFVAYDWLEIGWGDEGFYRNVPYLSALTLPEALRALFAPGNPSVLHVMGGVGAPRSVFAGSDMVRLALDRDGLDALARGIEATLEPGLAPRDRRGDSHGAAKPPSSDRLQDAPQELGPGLYGPSLFFRAAGAYHLTRNCNHWVARLLNGAGLPMSLAAATVSAGLMADLRWRSGAAAP
ncbi:DUF2459 domain-containing protein [Xanthobacter sp. AM11]|uniref:DUF2459 domain-containing protein n=1 Tax=Xanthobacter sp. AM11 TaxID=3380643 RepID=UPI0039BF4629